MNYHSAKKLMIEIGKRMYERGLIAGCDGNLSIRLPGGKILATTSGVSKGFLTEENLVLLDLEGKLLEPGRKASSEIKMHLFVYKSRADVDAICHAHPPFATGFAVSGMPLNLCVLPEVVSTLGAIPLAPYATPSTGEEPASLSGFIDKGFAVLLENHGVITMGKDLLEAYNRMETVEHFARILFISKQLGRVNVLTDKEYDKLGQMQKALGINYSVPECLACAAPEKSGAGAEDINLKAVIESVIDDILKAEK